MTSIAAAVAALYVIYREKRAVIEHAAALTGKDAK